MKSCYYKVASTCGSLDQGDIIEAVEIVKDGRRALILLPSETHHCPCLVMCRQDSTHKRKRLWVEAHQGAWVNLTEKQVEALNWRGKPGSTGVGMMKGKTNESLPWMLGDRIQTRRVVLHRRQG